VIVTPLQHPLAGFALDAGSREVLKWSAAILMVLDQVNAYNWELTLQQLLGEQWEHIYRVIPYPRYDAEYDVANWYTATHPDAPYLSNMIAAYPLPDGSRLTMFNGRVTLRAPNGESRRRILETPEAFAVVLREEFALTVSDGDLHEMLRGMEERGARGAPHPFFA
jgi:N-hydroxyarylamine O-acetyltransferase